MLTYLETFFRSLKSELGLLLMAGALREAVGHILRKKVNYALSRLG
jgi:hypothetical protein